MTVNQLIIMLQKENPNSEIIMSKDSEGNIFSPLYDISTGMYSANNSWSGEVGPLKLTPELEKLGYTKEDIMTDGVSALVLWPIN